MPPPKDNILQFNQYMKSDKMPFTIYADLESLIKKIGRSANNPEKSSLIKIGEHIPYGYLMPNIWAFDNVKNNYSLYCGEYCMEKFCSSLR